MIKSSDLNTKLANLNEKLLSSEDYKSIAEEALTLAKTAIDAFEISEREIKILTGC